MRKTASDMYPRSRMTRETTNILRPQEHRSMKKIFILYGHPDSVGMCHDLAEAYETAARAAGNSVSRLNIGEMRFDPVLHHGYR